MDNMDNISKEVIDNFSFEPTQINKIKLIGIEFSGEICPYCKIYVNIPRIELFWKCFNCESINKFDFSNVTIPFINPDAGPTKKRIEFPYSYSSIEDIFNGQFY